MLEIKRNPKEREQNIVRHTMTGHNFNKLLKELASWKNIKVIRDKQDYVTVLYNGSKLLTSSKGIGGKGRIVKSVEGLITTT